MIDITAQTCPLYIVHLSSNEALEHIKRAKDRGQKIYCKIARRKYSGAGGERLSGELRRLSSTMAFDED